LNGFQSFKSRLSCHRRKLPFPKEKLVPDDIDHATNFIVNARGMLLYTVS
jgi:hypothetical protein